MVEFNIASMFTAFIIGYGLLIPAIIWGVMRFIRRQAGSSGL